MQANPSRLVLFMLLLFPAASFSQPSALQQAAELTDQARVLARSERPEAALPLYEAALNLVPEDPDTQRDYGIALGWSGDYSHAATVFRTVLAAEPLQPAWSRLEMANAELFGGEPKKAAALFATLIQEGDSREVILTRHAFSLRRSRQYEEAAEAYRLALSRYPDSETAALGIVECFLDKRRAEDAYAFIVTWSEGQERSAQILAWRGWLLSLLGRHDEAQQLFSALPPDAFASQIALAGRALAWRLHNENTLPVLPYTMTPNAVDPDPSTLEMALSGIGTTRQAQALAAEGVTLAREGSSALGLAYLQHAVEMQPTNLPIRRDYAVVLSWAEHYVEASLEFDSVFLQDPDQPVWARSDRAQAALFGGAPEKALAILNELLQEGYVDERNLIRKGLALRWSGKPEQAERLYKQISALYPESSAGPDGLIHSLADQNRLGAAIKTADSSMTRLPNHWDLVKSRAQVLNWAGRHLQAEKTLATLPQEQAFQSDVLHHRALAARWTDNAQAAADYAKTFVQRNPGDADAYRLREQLAYQYGYGFRSSGDYFGDTDGFFSRGLRQEFEAPLTLSHRLEVGVNRQFFEQQGENANWTTYGIGWNGQLSRRLTASARAGQSLYGGDDRSQRLNLNASANLLVSDRIRLRGGVGQEPTTAFHAIQRRVQTQYGFLEADLKPTVKTQLSFRTARTAFSGSTVRQGFDAAAFLRVLDKRYLRLRVGTRNGWIFHDRPSNDVYSPDSLHSHLAAMHLQGRLPGELDYVAEFGSGVQFESGSPRTIPFSSTIELARRLHNSIWLRLQAGHSNSAMDRTNAGLPSYRMSYAKLQLDYRLKREF